MKENFGKNLKVFRAIYGDTQTDLAKKLGVSLVSVSNWEKGKNFPQMHTIEKLTALYNCTVDDLLKERNKI